MNAIPRPARIYIALIVCSALILAFIALLSDFPDFYSLFRVLIFSLIVFIADLYPIRLPTEDGAEVTVSCAFKTTAVIVFGAPVAVPATLLGTLLAESTLKRPWYAALFNAAEMTLTAAAMSAVYGLCQDPSATTVFATPRNGLAVVALVLTYAVVNTGLVTLVMSLTREVNFFHVWKSNFRDSLWNNLTIIPLGAVMAVLWQQQELSLLFLVLPIIVVRKSFEYIAELRRQTRETLINMADAIDRRDASTYEHSQRVAQFTESISRELGLPAEDCQTMHLAARLHDLGKIGMSNALLFKPGRFTEQEREQFQEHSRIGADLVESFRLFREGRELILYHHERYDGRGYPTGLGGEDIPLGSRIIAVADSFDAMTAKRVYKDPMPPEAGIRELQANKGTQFDPQIVDVFAEIMGRGNGAAPERGDAPAQAGSVS